MNDCIYHDGEIISRGEHHFDKDGFCNVCGMTREQAEGQRKAQLPMLNTTGATSNPEQTAQVVKTARI